MATGRAPLSAAFALLAALGCGEEARVSYAFLQEPGFEVDLLTLEFSDGSLTRRLSGDDFGGEGSRVDTPEFATRTSGELRTSFWLVAGADTLAAGEQRIELRPDFRWELTFRRSSSDPTVTCFGCFGRAAFALAPSLRASPADSLWIVWGGNYISNPVVY